MHVNKEICKVIKAGIREVKSGDCDWAVSNLVMEKMEIFLKTFFMVANGLYGNIYNHRMTFEKELLKSTQLFAVYNQWAERGIPGYGNLSQPEGVSPIFH